MALHWSPTPVGVCSLQCSLNRVLKGFFVSSMKAQAWLIDCLIQSQAASQLIDGYHCVNTGAELSPYKEEHTLIF